MNDRPLRILQISTGDFLGGAEKVAWNLFTAYRRHGMRSVLAVGRKRTRDDDVVLIPDLGVDDACASNGTTREDRPPVRLRKAWCRFTGLEDFEFPQTRKLIDWAATQFDIVHCHNLHGRYFDLRLLPELSKRVPTFITLHDAWMLAGHCAHSFDCQRWRTGCGRCPDLSIYPAVRRDATARNWNRKLSIYDRSRLHIATPCHWLMRKVEDSILSRAAVEKRIIPYGVDLSVFRPNDRRRARTELGLDPNAHVLLFAANGIRRNPWKDYATMRAAVEHLARTAGDDRPLIFLALGESGDDESVGDAVIRFVPFQPDPQAVARYYQAADLYIHAARADTFPNVVLEALACGLPVVATDVGGIAEQVKALSTDNRNPRRHTLHAGESATGMLVEPADPGALADAVRFLLTDDALRLHLGRNATRDAATRFHPDRERNAYLQWYAEALGRSHDGERAQNLPSIPATRPARTKPLRTSHPTPTHA